MVTSKFSIFFIFHFSFLFDFLIELTQVMSTSTYPVDRTLCMIKDGPISIKRTREFEKDVHLWPKQHQPRRLGLFSLLLPIQTFLVVLLLLLQLLPLLLLLLLLLLHLEPRLLLKWRWCRRWVLWRTATEGTGPRVSHVQYL